MKKTLKAMTLAAVMVFGATFAQAGIIVTDRQASCNEKEGIIVTDRSGIIVTDRSFGGIISSIIGIIVTDLVGKSDDGCEGIIVTDRDGIIVTD
jgi:hypothetical protein